MGIGNVWCTYICSTVFCFCDLVWARPLRPIYILWCYYSRRLVHVSDDNFFSRVFAHIIKRTGRSIDATTTACATDFWTFFTFRGTRDSSDWTRPKSERRSVQYSTDTYSVGKVMVYGTGTASHRYTQHLKPLLVFTFFCSSCTRLRRL